MTPRQPAKADHPATDLDDAVRAFVDARPRLYAIAYGVLRDPGEAEDVVQDVWIRWQGTDRSVVECSQAFLSTAARRLALNVAASARWRRETSMGERAPEPVAVGAGPQESAERTQQVANAIRKLLESVTLTEGAVYVLREGFGYPYDKIASILRLRTATARQLMSRARKRLAAGRWAPVDDAALGSLTTVFLSAARTGEVGALEEFVATHLRPRVA